MTVAARRNLEAHGATVLSYIPNQAYAVGLDPAAARALAKDPSVQWVGPYRPDYKLSAEIGTRTFTDPNRPVRPGQRLLAVSIFEDEDVDAAAQAAQRLGAEVLSVNRNPRTARLEVRVARGTERALAAIDAVEWVEEVGEPTLRNNITRWVAQSNVTNVLPVWDAGIHGEGQIIGHIDGGIARTSCYFIDLTNNTPGPNHRKLVGYRGAFQSDTHGTHTGGTAAGLNSSGDLSNAGLAYMARISHTNLGLVTSTNLYAYFDSASVQGANVHTNSWGDDGTTAYTSWCHDIDAFSRDREDDLVCFAVTNTSTLKTPENAKNVLAVGATNQAPNQETWGSGGRGPTADGRRKPEVALPGIGIVSAGTSTCSTASLSGTSMASPAVTGCAALVREYYEHGYYPSGAAAAVDDFVPTAALVKATLINGSQDMTGVAGYPSTTEGWGRILLHDALHFTGDARRNVAKDVRNADGLATGQQSELLLNVDNSQTLRVTMAYTDQPALTGAAFTPINNLDLELQGPDGLFLGNVFTSGVSAHGGTADALNNVERAILPAGLFTSGQWTVRVRATSVPDGPQGYAIQVSGAVTEVGGATGVEPLRSTVLATGLLSTSPNPFSRSTEVRFSVAKREAVTLAVYDVSGRKVRTLASGLFEAGSYSYPWDARDEQGARVAAGIYFTRLQGAGVDQTRKMVLLR